MLFPELSRLPIIDSARIVVEGVEGTFKTFESGRNVLVEIAVKSDEKVRVELNSDPMELEFGGMKNLDRTESSVNITQGKVVLTNLQSEQTIIAFSERGEIRRNLEGRIYKGTSLLQSVTLRPR